MRIIGIWGNEMAELLDLSSIFDKKICHSRMQGHFLLVCWIYKYHFWVFRLFRRLFWNFFSSLCLLRFCDNRLSVFSDKLNYYFFHSALKITARKIKFINIALWTITAKKIAFFCRRCPIFTYCFTAWYIIFVPHKNSSPFSSVCDRFDKLSDIWLNIKYNLTSIY